MTPIQGILHFFPWSSSPLKPMDSFAGTSLLHRAIIQAQRSGIKKVYLWLTDSDCSWQENAQQSLTKDSRINIPWEWIREEKEIRRSSDENLFLFGYNLISNPKSWQQFIQEPRNSHQQVCDEHGNLLCAIIPSDQIVNLFDSPQQYCNSLESQVRDDFIHLSQNPKSDQKRLLYSLQSPLEGQVDVYFNRPIGRLIALTATNLKISPNAISLVSILLGLVSAWMILAANYTHTIIAALLLQVSAILDCIDGDVARMQLKESTLGKWLDMAGDNVVHLAFFVCLGFREYYLAPSNTIIALAAALAFATVVSFFIVVYIQTKFQEKQKAQGKSISTLQKFIEKMTNRDFTVLLIIGSIIGNLTWFLWIAAIGSQVFWMALLIMIWKDK